MEVTRRLVRMKRQQIIDDFASGHDHHLLSSFTGNKPAHSGGVFDTFFREGFYDSV